MAYAMTKQGSLDNCVTYEFICDTIADMNAIENRYRSIGSVAIVLQGESEGLEVYIAGSDKNWNSLSSAGADSSTTGGLSIYICGQDEVDELTGLPDIEEPDETSIYLVPAGETSGNLYEEYIYVDDAWEKFGSASIDLSNYIQKTDIATQSTAGLVKVLDNGNVTFNENNQLVLTLAGTAVVKSGQSDHPISVTHQHEAAFYGLAKAAGQDMKNSGNAVGTYTTEAASAIRTMIGAGTYSKPAGGIPANDLAETYLTQHQDISGLYTKPAGGIPASDLAAGVIPDTSIYAPKASPEFTGSISLGRKANTTVGANSVAEGLDTIASGNQSHAEGYGGTYTKDNINYTSAAVGMADHVEGYQCLTAMNQPGNHAEGYQTRATGGAAHSEGILTIASANATHAEGISTTASGAQSHAEGFTTTASGPQSHSEGNNTTASGSQSHAEGNVTTASGNYSHSEGDHTVAQGIKSHAEGYGGTYTKNNIQYTSSAAGMSDHIEGYQCLTTNGQPGNHAEGYQTQATGGASHSEGTNTTASGVQSHAEGGNTIASGSQSHAEGGGTTASGQQSHAEGASTAASGPQSHAEGASTTASGAYSHTEGLTTIAIGTNEHVSGKFNVIDSASEWQASTSYQIGDLVSKSTTFTDGSNTARTRTVIYRCKTANSDSTFKSSKWEESGIYAEIIGNGTADNARSNARALDWDGNEYLMGDIYVNCNADGTGGTKLTPTDTSGLAPRAYPIFTGAISLGRKSNTTNGSNSIAVGTDVTASGMHSSAFGHNTTASGAYSHAFGSDTTASGALSFALGRHTAASGGGTIAAGFYNADMTSNPNWTANTSYAVNDRVKQNGFTYKCIEANNDAEFTSSKWISLVDQNTVQAIVVGNGRDNNEKSNALTLDWSGDLHLLGDIYTGANADGTGGTKLDTSTLAPKASPEFTGSISLGRKDSTTVGAASSAIGYTVEASGDYSHAEGYNTRATAEEAHAEGIDTEALSQAAHAEGRSSRATAYLAHAEGYTTTASGSYSHSEGNTTTANHKAQHAGGEFNVLDASAAAANERGNYVEIIGNGTGTSARSNARVLDWSGNEYLNGDIYVGCDASSANGIKLARIPAAPSTDGTYILQCVVSSGVPTYSWISAPNASGVNY